MDADRHARASAIFLEACDLPPGERAEFIAGQCGDDVALRNEVEALLAHDAAPAIVDQPIADPGWSADADGDTTLPTRIGHYAIIDVLGAGGMGTVYRARQDDPARDVALKVLRPGAISASLLSRFRYEAEVLGRLQHPGIARIYEAGSTGDDDHARPYFAMELVEGLPLDDYVREHDLDRDARLRLFVEICDAVHFAHQKGVIHRDLKPGNILVDDRGRPRVLDFGVARATDADLRTVTMQTGTGQILGTIPYMSPEQISGNPDTLDVRSDVYALGVLLYELLAGRLPYDLARRTIPDAARVIRDEPPTRIGTIDTTCRGDLETIIGKTLEKEPERRYDSAAELAADLRRFLEHEPILARAPSVAYQARLFARRHRALVAAGTVVMIALLVGSMVSIAFAVRATGAATEEARQRHTAERIIAQMNGMLRSPDPHGLGHDVTVAELLEATIRQLDTDASEPPEVEAVIRDAIGEAYTNQGRWDDAEPQLRKAIELYARIDPLHTRRALLLIQLAVGQMKRGDAVAAEASARAGLAIHAERPFRSTGIAQAMLIVADALVARGEHAEAEAYARALTKTHLREDGETIATIMAYFRLGVIQNRIGAFDRAAATLDETIAMTRRTLDDRHPLLASAMHQKAIALREAGRMDEAVETMRAAWSLIRAHRTVGGTDWVSASRALVDTLAIAGRQPEADAAMAGFLDEVRALEDPPRRRRALRAYAVLYDTWGRGDRAAALREEAGHDG